MKNQGFTLIETLIAIFILTMTVGALLTLAAGGYFSVRYARNEIVGNSLMQEALEYIRNDRDTASQSGTGYWSNWVAKYNSCTSASGCIVDPYTTTANAHIQSCSGACPVVTFYPSIGFYGYSSHGYPSVVQTSGGGNTPYNTTYVRTIIVQNTSDPNQIIVNASVSWSNGDSPTRQTASQSILLTNWNP